MDLGIIFQLAASATAILCSSLSLALWLLYTNALDQTERGRNRLIYGQIIIGGIIILGSIASMILAFKATASDNGMQIKLFGHINYPNQMSDTSRSISPMEIGFVLLLLVLNEVSAVSKSESDTDTLS